MKNSFLKIILALVFCLSPFVVSASSADNISGYAWSENIGWISFNNTANYGVNIDMQNGDLTGYAWSENIGWISFNRGNAGNPPVAPFNGGSGAIAKYNLNTKEVTGWARVLANGGGWDGWIRFCDSSMANCSNKIARIDDNGDWHGWAWSDVVAGWISLNCADQGNCGVSDYKVKIALPAEGACNPFYNGTTQPSSTDFNSIPNLCNSPSAADSDTSLVTTGSGWTWTCPGQNGGSPASCETYKCVATAPIYGNCDKSCGGGTRIGTYQNAECQMAFATPQSCNSQPCPPGYKEVAPW